jgi:hypothetical protein
MELTEEVLEFVDSYRWMNTKVHYLELLIELDFSFLHPVRSEIILREEKNGPCVGEKYVISDTQTLIIVLEGYCTPSGLVVDISLHAYISPELFNSTDQYTLLSVLRYAAGIERDGPYVQDDMFVLGWDIPSS